ncbi:hypothetical protein ROZALSC1DRAFT_28817 [Rozella allomycis CSF55]|uniref:Uncharacterized protein n=2 Tax=Rozella allomycis (strain CSF55) TaxID=988480 RepID=A0A4P9YM32_ROZAC|nr:hypothetical protein ROZALSC1DRAFT_28817 [Rozella allomycis CSF55]
MHTWLSILLLAASFFCFPSEDLFENKIQRLEEFYNSQSLVINADRFYEEYDRLQKRYKIREKHIITQLKGILLDYNINADKDVQDEVLKKVAILNNRLSNDDRQCPRLNKQLNELLNLFSVKVVTDLSLKYFENNKQKKVKISENFFGNIDVSLKSFVKRGSYLFQLVYSQFISAINYKFENVQEKYIKSIDQALTSIIPSIYNAYQNTRNDLLKDYIEGLFELKLIPSDELYFRNIDLLKERLTRKYQKLKIQKRVIDIDVLRINLMKLLWHINDFDPNPDHLTTTLASFLEFETDDIETLLEFLSTFTLDQKYISLDNLKSSLRIFLNDQTTTPNIQPVLELFNAITWMLLKDNKMH